MICKSQNVIIVTKRTRPTNDQHDPPAPRDTPFGEPLDATAHHGQLDRQPGTTLLRFGTRPSGNLPTQWLITASSTGIQARPSCASGHALRGTSQRNGSSRPARQAAKHDPPEDDTTIIHIRTRRQENQYHV